MEASERFFRNRDCPYFPCHRGIAEEDFNCLFCYCPLYMLGGSCGGDWRRSPSGYKDCSACTFPHRPENYDRILARYREIADAIAGKDPEERPGGGKAGRETGQGADRESKQGGNGP